MSAVRAAALPTWRTMTGPQQIGVLISEVLVDLTAGDPDARAALHAAQAQAEGRAA